MATNSFASELERQISRTKTLSVALLIAGLANAGLVALLAGAIVSSGAAVLVFLLILAWVTIAYLCFDFFILRSTGARLPTAQEQARLQPIVQRLSGYFLMEPPRIMVRDGDECNAFAVGSNPRRAAVVFTTGILRLLNDDELEGVAAHELSHIANHDARAGAISGALFGWALLLSAIATVIAFGLGAWGIGAMGSSGDGDGDWASVLAMICTGIVLICLAIAVWFAGATWFLIAQLTHLGFHRQREWMADQTAAQVTGKPLALAAALQKLAGSETKLAGGRMMAQSLCIAGLPKSGGWSDLMSTHPDINRRIDRLRGYAGVAPLSGGGGITLPALNIREAAIPGLVAGILMIVVALVLTNTNSEYAAYFDFWVPLRAIGFRVFGYNYFWHGIGLGSTAFLIVGLGIHLAVAAGLGVAFGTVVAMQGQAVSTTRYIVWGVIGSLVVWFFATYFALPFLIDGFEGINVRWREPTDLLSLVSVPGDVWILAHCIYGATVGLLTAQILRRKAAPYSATAMRH